MGCGRVVYAFVLVHVSVLRQLGIGDDVAWRFEGGLARCSSERLAGTDSDEPLVCLNYLLAFMGRIYNEFRNAMRSAFWASDKALKKFLENVPPAPA